MRRGENLRKHGLTGTPEHRSWLSMITRCHGSHPSRSDWHLYQGAGITVCDRWRASFAAFLEDMGQKPSPRHSIERIDSAKNYEPSNCIWASPKQQARNTTRNRRITLNNETLTLSAWAERTGLKRETISDRLGRGWTIERALTTPRMANRDRDERGQYA